MKRGVAVGQNFRLPARNFRDDRARRPQYVADRPAVRNASMLYGNGEHFAVRALAYAVFLFEQLEKLFVNPVRAGNIPDKIPYRNPDHHGKQGREAPGELAYHDDARNRRLDDGGKKGRHADHYHEIGVFCVHAQGQPAAVEQRADTRPDRQHGDKRAAGHARAHIDAGNDEFQNQRHRQRADEGKRKNARRTLLRRAAQGTQGLDERVSSAHNVDRNQRKRAAEEHRRTDRRPISRARIHRAKLFKQPAEAEYRLIKQNAQQAADEGGEKNKPVSRNVHFVKHVSFKRIGGRASHRRIDRRMRQKPRDNRRKGADKHFGRKPFMRLLESERHARQRRVERHGQPRARPARHLIAAHHFAAAEQARHAVAAGAADL